MDEFSSKTACVTPQNSQIDDWMSFPVKRPQNFPRNLPIRVIVKLQGHELDLITGKLIQSSI